jgi:proline iminopeptidase
MKNLKGYPMRSIVYFVSALLLFCAPAIAKRQNLRRDKASPLSAGAHRLRVGDVELWYRVAGKTAGVPVVFLHGGPGEGSQVFQAFGGPQLEKTHRLIYFDQRGAGRSDRPKDAAAYSIDILVNDIEQLRQYLGVPTIVLLGHSFGTQLSLEYAVKYPQHTAALVLAAATPHLARSIDLQCERLQHEDPAAFARAVNPIGALPRCNTMAAYSGDEAKAFAMRNLFPDPSTGKKVEALDNADGLRNTGEISAALFRKGFLQYHFTDAANVRAPVLVIAGGRDFQAAIEVQRDLVKALPNALLVEYPSDGHFMFVEDPQAFARDVSCFLRMVSP